MERLAVLSGSRLRVAGRDYPHPNQYSRGGGKAAAAVDPDVHAAVLSKKGISPMESPCTYVPFSPGTAAS